MGHKGHWGEYTGNAKWSRDHAHTRVTSKNYDDAVKDDAAHIDYLKRDINYDAKHGHSDENMTADEKHISKLAGDMKYDKEHHGSPTKKIGEMKDHGMGYRGWEAHKKTMHGIKEHGGPNMSAFHAHDEWQVKIDAAKEEWENADPPKKGDFHEENQDLYKKQEEARLAHKEEKRNAAPQQHCMGNK